MAGGAHRNPRVGRVIPRVDTMHQGDRDEVKGVYHINGIGLDLLGWVLDACATNPSHDIAAEHIRTECALNLKGDKPCAPLWRTLRRGAVA